MIKFLFRIFLLVGASILIYFVPTKFMPLDFFTIKKVNIQGDAKISLRELTEMGKITYNKNVWGLDLGFIEDELKKDIRIANAKVTANAAGEITFDVDEREAFCYAQVGTNLYLLDEFGNNFGFLNEKEKKNLPLVILDGKTSEDQKRQALIMIDIIRSLDKTMLKELISQVYEKNPESVDLILTDGTIIKTNPNVEKSKYKVTEDLYSELIKESKIEYIDLRFDDFVVKKFGG